MVFNEICANAKLANELTLCPAFCTNQQYERSERPITPDQSTLDDQSVARMRSGISICTFTNPSMTHYSPLARVFAAGTTLLHISFWWQTKRSLYLAGAIVFLLGTGAGAFRDVVTETSARTLIMGIVGISAFLAAIIDGIAFLTQQHTGPTWRQHTMRMVGILSIAEILLAVLLTLARGAENLHEIKSGYQALVLLVLFLAFWNFDFTQVQAQPQTSATNTPPPS